MALKKMSNSKRQHDELRNDQLQGDHWEPCPPGELSRMVQRVGATADLQRRRQLYKTALLSTALFACVVLAVGSLMPSNNHYGGIACSVCRGHIPEYVAHVENEKLMDDADLLASVKLHLEKCKFCQQWSEVRYPDLLSATLGTAGRPAMLAVPTLLASGQQPWY